MARHYNHITVLKDNIECDMTINLVKDAFHYGIFITKAQKLKENLGNKA